MAIVFTFRKLNRHLAKTLMWIGLERKDKGHDWEWSDGTFPTWAPWLVSLIDILFGNLRARIIMIYSIIVRYL